MCCNTELCVQTHDLEVVMKTLLVVNSSPRSNSVSRQLTRRVAEDWQAKNPDGRVLERDLAAEALPLPQRRLDSRFLYAGRPKNAGTATDTGALRRSDRRVVYRRRDRAGRSDA